MAHGQICIFIFTLAVLLFYGWTKNTTPENMENTLFIRLNHKKDIRLYLNPAGPPVTQVDFIIIVIITGLQ